MTKTNEKNPEELWMAENLDVKIESADVDLLQLLADTTAYPQETAWVEPMMDSLKADAQFPHRVEMFWDRIFMACNAAILQQEKGWRS